MCDYCGMKLIGYTTTDNLILNLAGDGVRRDADGVPIAFRLFGTGNLSLTLDGQPVSGDITSADIKDIMAFHQLKGESIPIDCEHLIQKLADMKGVTESDLLKSEPLLGEKAAAGYATLKEEDGALWANVTKWSDRAKELLTSAADKMYGYVSPVLRGLKSPPLRITSLALTNLPAINGQDLLAATESSTTPKIKTATSRSRTMEYLNKLIALLGMDAVAMTAENADREPLFQKAAEEIEKSRSGVSEFLGDVREALGLTESDDLTIASGKILSLAEAAKGNTGALTEMQERLQDLEGKEKDRLIDKLKAEGKLTVAMVAWAKKQDTEALIEFAKDAPVVVRPTRTIAADAVDDGDDSMALTEEDKKVAAACGIDPAKVAETHGLKVE